MQQCLKAAEKNKKNPEQPVSHSPVEGVHISHRLDPGTKQAEHQASRPNPSRAASATARQTRRAATRGRRPSLTAAVLCPRPRAAELPQRPHRRTTARPDGTQLRNRRVRRLPVARTHCLSSPPPPFPADPLRRASIASDRVPPAPPQVHRIFFRR